MGILVISGLLCGLGLGQVFKHFILIPSVIVAAAIVVVRHMQMHPGVATSFLHFGALTTALQIGFFAGVAARCFFRSTLLTDEAVAAEQTRASDISSPLGEPSYLPAQGVDL